MSTRPQAAAQAAPPAPAEPSTQPDPSDAAGLTLERAPAELRRLTDERIARPVVPQPLELHIPLADDKRALYVVRARPCVAQLLRLVAHFRRPVPRGLWA